MSARQLAASLGCGILLLLLLLLNAAPSRAIPQALQLAALQPLPSEPQASGDCLRGLSGGCKCGQHDHRRQKGKAAWPKVEYTVGFVGALGGAAGQARKVQQSGVDRGRSLGSLSWLWKATQSFLQHKVVLHSNQHMASAETEQVQVQETATRRENKRPVIGIFTHPYYGPGLHSKLKNGAKRPPAVASIIPSSYVRMLQAGGAQVVPIFYDSTDAELKQAFAAVNLILFQGGFTSLSRFNFYYKNAYKLFQMVLEANDNKEYFAMHGTCLGLELLATIVSEEPKSRLMEEVDSLGQPAKLHFTSEAAKKRSLFSSFPDDLVDRVSRFNLTMENHKFALMPQLVEKNGKLSSFFEILTLSPDRLGKEYVSSMAAHHYPISATQWHPEKPPYEFYSTLNVPHSTAAVKVTNAVTAFLVKEARKNHRRVSKEALANLVVDKYRFEYQADLEDHDYDSVYIFPLRRGRSGDASVDTGPTEVA